MKVPRAAFGRAGACLTSQVRHVLPVSTVPSLWRAGGAVRQRHVGAGPVQSRGAYVYGQGQGDAVVSDRCIAHSTDVRSGSRASAGDSGPGDPGARAKSANTISRTAAILDAGAHQNRRILRALRPRAADAG